MLDQAAGQEIPNPQEHAAVELLGWLELHLDDAPVTVIAGANEPWLPESTSHHAFLPNGLCARLGITDNRMRYARDAYRLSAIRASRERLVVVAGRWDAQGNPLRPSRLLFAADGQTVARRVRRFYDAEFAAGDQPGPVAAEGSAAAMAGSGASDDLHDARDWGDGAVDAMLDRGDGAAPGARASGPGLLTLPPEPVIRFEPPTQIAVTDFRKMIQDRYGWVVERFRACVPVDDHAREMDSRIFGSLAHSVLEHFAQDGAVHSDDDRLIAGRLDALLDARVNGLFGPGARHARVAVRFQVEQLRLRLRRIAVWHAARVRDGWRVVGTEVSTPEGGVPFLVDDVPIGLKARIDRVEFHAGRREWAVLDYKTGDKRKDPGKEHLAGDGTWTDLQLPLYRWLLGRLTGPDGAPRFVVEPGSRVELGYVPISAEAEATLEQTVEWGDAELETALEQAREEVRWLRGGVARFDPDQRSKYADERLEALLGLGLLASSPEMEDGE